MLQEKPSLIQELTWEEARPKVAELAKPLGKIIDNLSPSKEFTIFQVRYPFGSKIFDKNQFYLPLDTANSVPISDPKISSNLKNHLTYSSLPLGIVCKNQVEKFLDFNRKIFSLAVLSGDLTIGIEEHLGWSMPYTLTSGARSLYMLPKISDALSHKKLKKRFALTDAPPKCFYDQWQIFTKIANSPEFPASWFCELLFLSEKWHTAAIWQKDSAWLTFNSYLQQKALEHLAYSRKKNQLDIIWEFFIKFLQQQELKFDPYVIDTMKHLIYISIGALPASKPATATNEAGPLTTLQTIYEDHFGYALKEYIATIMQPAYFSITKLEPVYYSLQLPTLIETLPKTRKITSVIDNIRELSELLNCFLNKQNKFWPQGAYFTMPFNEILTRLQVDYFHGEIFAYGSIIKSSLKMPEFDPNLIYDPLNNQQRVFASNSSFLKGCIRIAAKK